MTRSSEGAGIVIAILLFGCSGTEEQPIDKPPIQVPSEEAPEANWWIQQYGKYMTEEERAAFLATPEEGRVAKFSEKLLDYSYREMILAETKVKLNDTEYEAYLRLQDYHACQDYIRRIEAEPGRAR